VAVGAGVDADVARLAAPPHGAHGPRPAGARRPRPQRRPSRQLNAQPAAVDQSEGGSMTCARGGARDAPVPASAELVHFRRRKTSVDVRRRLTSVYCRRRPCGPPTASKTPASKDEAPPPTMLLRRR
jgi:hypothetical protein